MRYVISIYMSTGPIFTPCHHSYIINEICINIMANIYIWYSHTAIQMDYRFVYIHFLYIHFLYIHFLYIHFLYIHFLYIHFLYIHFLYIHFFIWGTGHSREDNQYLYYWAEITQQQIRQANRYQSHKWSLATWFTWALLEIIRPLWFSTQALS